jgi:hypothetical protein
MTSRRIKDDDLFLMQLKGRWWNCLPLSNLLMLSPHQGGFFILAEKSEVVLRPAHPNLTARRQFSVLVKLKEELLTGKIQRAGYEKYVFWKGETDPSNLPELAQKWRNRRIIWYAEVGILVLIGLYILSIFLYLRPYM